MDKYIIITEIQNLYITTNVSMCIEGPKKEFHLYSNDFIKRLRELNTIIKKIKHNDFSYSHSISRNEIIKVRNKSTFIVFEQELNISLKAKELFKFIDNLINPLITLFSLFLRNFFSIKRIYIFKKKNYGYEFLRLIDVFNHNEEISEDPQLIQILNVEGVETIFPWLLHRIYQKKEYIPLIIEYLTGRIKAPNIEMKFMLYWNALEHFAHTYWKKKHKSKILSKIKIKELNKCIKEKVNCFNQEEILFPNITLNDIKTKGYLRVSSKPPIKEQIFSLIKRIRIKSALNNIQDLIDKVYYIRNKLFHANYFIEDILESFKDNYNCPNFEIDEFSEIIKNYELFFEFLILKYFKIIPNYFNYKLSKRWKHFHFLEWKKIKLSSVILKKDIIRKKLDEKFEKEYEDPKDYELNYFLCDKAIHLSRGKYISLMKFISRFNKSLIKQTQNNYFIGYTNTRTGFSEIQIKFINTLKGRFNIQNSLRHTHFLNGYIIEESPVFSKKFINNSTYGLSFELSEIKTFPIDISADFEHINGEFKILIRDIQKL